MPFQRESKPQNQQRTRSSKRSYNLRNDLVHGLINTAAFTEQIDSLCHSEDYFSLNAKTGRCICTGSAKMRKILLIQVGAGESWRSEKNTMELSRF